MWRQIQGIDGKIYYNFYYYIHDGSRIVSHRVVELLGLLGIVAQHVEDFKDEWEIVIEDKNGHR